MGERLACDVGCRIQLTHAPGRAHQMADLASRRPAGGGPPLEPRVERADEEESPGRAHEMRLDVAGTTRFNLRQLQVQGRADGETFSLNFCFFFL